MKKTGFICFVLCFVFLESIVVLPASAKKQKKTENISEETVVKVAEEAEKTNKKEKSEIKKALDGKSINLNFYVNCPRTTEALTVELALKATVDNYKGVVNYQCSGAPSAKSLDPIAEYYSYCKFIEEMLEKTTGDKYSLAFNTEKDGSGEFVSIANSSQTLKTVEKLMHSDNSTVYAIYTTN